MGNLYDWDAVEFTDANGATLDDGSPDGPIAIGGVTVGVKKTFTLAPNATQILWASTNSDPADFLYARIKSSVGDSANGFPMLELTTDLANVSGRQVYTVPLLADGPFKLFGSQSYANYTLNFGGGVLSKIQQFRVKNLNLAAATISLIMAN